MITKETEEMIREHLLYENGVLYWTNLKRSYRSVSNGKEAGCLTPYGYIIVKVNQKLIFAHRIVYFLHNGVWPHAEIDHINKIRTDNRIENLRDCSRTQNSWNRNRKNSKYGRGISWSKDKNKYRVRVNKNGKVVFERCYDDLEFAQLVASEARKKYYGEFAYDY